MKSNCPVCLKKTDQEYLFTKKYFKARSAKFYRCSICTSLLEPRAIREPYDYNKIPCDDIRWYSEMNYGLIFFSFLDEFVEIAIKELKKKGIKKITICDFGGGYDYFGYFIKKNHPEIKMVCVEDNNAQNTFNKNKLGIKSLRYTQALQKYKNKAHIFIASEVIEHFQDPYIFKNIIESLTDKKNCFVLLTTPNSESADLTMKKNDWVHLGAMPGLHCILHTKKSLSTVFSTYPSKSIFEAEGLYGDERIITFLSKKSNKTIESVKSDYVKTIPGNSIKLLTKCIVWIKKLEKSGLQKKIPSFYYGSLMKAAVICINIKRYSEAKKMLDKIESQFLGRDYYKKLPQLLSHLKKTSNIYFTDNTFHPLALDFYLYYGFLNLICEKNNEALYYLHISTSILQIIHDENKIIYSANMRNYERSMLYLGIVYSRMNRNTDAIVIFDTLNKSFYTYDDEFKWNLFINRLNTLIRLEKYNDALMYLTEHKKDTYLKYLSSNRKKELKTSTKKLTLLLIALCKVFLGKSKTMFSYYYK